MVVLGNVDVGRVAVEWKRGVEFGPVWLGIPVIFGSGCEGIDAVDLVVLVVSVSVGMCRSRVIIVQHVMCLAKGRIKHEAVLHKAHVDRAKRLEHASIHNGLLLLLLLLLTVRGVMGRQHHEGMHTVDNTEV